jgi:O-antigen/teichoic acid export membrane protein
VFGGSVISMLFDPFNKLMLSRYAGVSIIPIYEITYNAAVQIRSLIESGLRPIMPEISRLCGLGAVSSIMRIKSINRKLIKLILIFGLPFYIILFILAGTLMQLWLRGKYNNAILPAFRLVLIATFLNLLSVPAFHTLLGLGKASCSLVSSIIVSGGNFVLVLTNALLFNRVSVNSIFVGLIALLGLSTIYLVIKVHSTVGSLVYSDDY